MTYNVVEERVIWKKLTRIDLKNDVYVPWEHLGKIVPWVSGPIYQVCSKQGLRDSTHLAICYYKDTAFKNIFQTFLNVFTCFIH